MKRVSVIIKALNEEENITRAIESALTAVKPFKGEVILADSISTDKTVEIAKSYPITIVQLKNKSDRCCGVGPQIGFLSSKGEYVYILDGDMELNPDFIRKGIEELEKDKTLAGVGGMITEMTDSNIVFRRRKSGAASVMKTEEYCDKLMMGGIYRREPIEKVGYFSNPFLHAYEESDLGNRLTILGYRLKRLAVPMIKHYGDRKSSIDIIIDRWRSRYLWGCGEYLRYNLFKPTMVKVVKELKLYLAVICAWIGLVAALISLTVTPYILYAYLLVVCLLLIAFLIKKRNLQEYLFSLLSWNITSLGLLCGLFSKTKNIKAGVDFKVLKWG